MNLENVSLSVVVPITKSAHSLAILESWLQNIDYFQIKVYLIHDKQDELTGPAIETMLSRLSCANLVYVEYAIGSPGGARNIGKALCKTDWVAFWDADDLPNLENFYSMIENAEYSHAEICIGSFELSNQEKDVKKIFRLDPSHPERSFFEISLNPGIWRFAFRRNLIENINFPDYRMGEDQVFLARLGFTSRNVFLFQKVVYEYEAGVVSSLTKQKLAIQDLQYALRDLKYLVRNSDSSKNEFLFVIILRQSITYLRHSDLSVKMEIISNLVSVIFNNKKVYIKILWSIFYHPFRESIQGEL